MKRYQIMKPVPVRKEAGSVTQKVVSFHGYMVKYNLFYSHTKSRAFLAPIFVKIKIFNSNTCRSVVPNCTKTRYQTGKFWMEFPMGL